MAAKPPTVVDLFCWMMHVLMKKAIPASRASAPSTRSCRFFWHLCLFLTQLYQFEFPNRPPWRGYRTSEMEKLRIKPRFRRVELEVPVDMGPENYDASHPLAASKPKHLVCAPAGLPPVQIPAVEKQSAPASLAAVPSVPALQAGGGVLGRRATQGPRGRGPPVPAAAAPHAADAACL